MQDEFEIGSEKRDSRTDIKLSVYVQNNGIMRTRTSVQLGFEAIELIL